MSDNRKMRDSLNLTCSDRGTSEDDFLNSFFVLAMAVIGICGTVLNVVVILGVLDNARLGTTVNKLLIWICSFALLEATLGITIKSLILGKRGLANTKWVSKWSLSMRFMHVTARHVA